MKHLRLISMMLLALTSAMGVGGSVVLQGCVCAAPVAFPSVEVTVVDSQTNAPINDATVTATRSGSPSLMFPGPVDAGGGNTTAGTMGGRYEGRGGVAGDYQLTVTKAGYTTATQTIRAGAGGCDSNYARVMISLVRM